MDFDSTYIAIRERGFAELLDLALQVIRHHAAPLLLALVIGTLPWAVLNWWLFSGMLADGIWTDPTAYVFWNLFVVALQAPFATALMTLYLGQVTFADRVDAGRLLRDFFGSLPQMLLMQGVARCLTGVLVVTLLMPYVLWPYLSELILLERNPLFARRRKNSGGQHRLSTSRRSKNLHRGAGGDLFSRWLVSVAVGGLLVVALVGGLHALAKLLLSFEADSTFALMWTFPFALWLVVGFFAVVRFLAYLDLRIRREGWEVELTMRTEADRLARGFA